MIVAKINKILIIGLFSFLFVPTVFGAYEISDGTVKGLWHFNGDVVDSSGNGLNGTNNGNSAGTGVAKLGSNSLVLDGTGDYVSVADSALLDLGTNNFSFNIWQKHVGASTNSYPTILGPAGTWSAGAWGIRFDNLDAEGFSMHVNSATPADPFIYSPTSYSEDTWYMYTIVRSGTTVTMYINGNSVASGTYAGTFDFSRGGQMNIGWSAWDGANGYFQGNLDEGVILNKALSLTEISYLYNSGNGNEVCTTVGCSIVSSTSTSATSTIAESQDTMYWFLSYLLDAFFVGISTIFVVWLILL